MIVLVLTTSTGSAPLTITLTAPASTFLRRYSRLTKLPPSEAAHLLMCRGALRLGAEEGDVFGELDELKTRIENTSVTT